MSPIKITMSENALKVAESRYFMEGENWETCTERVARTVSQNDTGYKESFHEILYEQLFVPGGRILRNCGRSKGSLFNCYLLQIGDSIEEIGQFMKDALTLWSEGGGVGCNFSPLRPKGDLILGKGGKSSGLVSFMEAANNLSKTIESGGARRAAAMGLVDISHPEILDFIDAKTKDGKLDHFNISVAINDSFIYAVEKNLDWELKFNQKSYGKLKARDLWNKIITNMNECAEPGLINWSNFSKNNSYYFDPVMGANPCGEAILNPNSVCNLGSLVLPNFITGTVNTNWKKLETTIRTAVRFLDNIFEINKYVLKQNEIKAGESRRIGLGIMGLADYFFAKKLRYGSEKSIQETERLMKFIRDISYDASVELATEKGAFPKFDPIAFTKASFVRKFPASFRAKIKKHGIRNVTLLAIAPTGTISLLMDSNPSAEPLFSKAYRRKDRVGERVYINKLYKKFYDRGEEIPDWFVDAFDLKPEDHLNIQATIQRYVDGGVSKTILLPNNSTPESLNELLLNNILDLKGVTVYRDGCRNGQPINKMTDEEVIEYLKLEENSKEKKSTETPTELDVQCANGNCEI